MNKLNSNILLEVSNITSYNVSEKFFIELFQKLQKKNLLVHKIKNIALDNLVVSLVIVDNGEIRSINKRYRNKDKITDVLSFEFLAKDKFVLPKEKRILGEIFISYPEAIKKSRDLKILPKEELALLFIHGLLHLLGYDHIKKLEEKEMKKLENVFLKEINVFFKPN